MADGSKKQMTMKKIFNLMFAAVAICLTAACQKEEIKDSVNPELIGEWHLSTVEVDGAVQSYPYDVYLTINNDCTFELYQKSGTQMRYTKFTGTCKSEGKVLSGVYASGTPWGDSYNASVEGDVLVLISSDGVEMQEYKKESLSAEEKLAADISTKSAMEIAHIL